MIISNQRPIRKFASTSLFVCPKATPPSSYALSLHDALPIYSFASPKHQRDSGIDTAHAATTSLFRCGNGRSFMVRQRTRSEEHTSELQSRLQLVCRLQLEKKRRIARPTPTSTTHPFIPAIQA